MNVRQNGVVLQQADDPEDTVDSTGRADIIVGRRKNQTIERNYCEHLRKQRKQERAQQKRAHEVPEAAPRARTTE